jgi:hypothetical protein
LRCQQQLNVFQSLFQTQVVKVEIDAKWDGLKGYITNTQLSAKTIIENYKDLWQKEMEQQILYDLIYE